MNRAREAGAIHTHSENLKLPRRDARRKYTERTRSWIDPIVRLLVRLGVTPNALSVAGMIGAVLVAGLVLGRLWVAAGLVFVAASLMDVLDGSVARRSGRGSAFGAFLDSTFDRLAEGLVLGAIGVTLAQDGEYVAVGACFLALTASFLVSYTRARAEGLGVDSNRGGLMSRPERLVLTGAGIFLAPVGPVLQVVVIVLAALTVLTVAQRLVHVHRALARPARDAEPR